jgi:hypothetical protein
MSGFPPHRNCAVNANAGFHFCRIRKSQRYELNSKLKDQNSKQKLKPFTGIMQ